MASINSGVIATVGATRVKITNLVLALADTEVAHALSGSLKGIEFRARSEAKIQYAFTENESGVTYMTVPKCSTQSFSGLSLISATLYLQADTATTIEIIEFF